MRAMTGMLPILILTSSCATMSNRTKTILTMAGAGIVAGSIGAYFAPSDEKSYAHAAMWGGSAAAVSGLVSLYVFDEQSKSEELDRKLKLAERENRSLRGEGDVSRTQMIYDSDSSLERDLPPEYRSLVQPGKWSVYGVDQWVMSGENEIIHQDKKVRLILPQFKPKGEKTPEMKPITHDGGNKS